MPTEPFFGLADPVSAATHLLGACLCAAALPALVRAAPPVAHARLAFTLFGATCMLLLATSGVYHALAHDTPARALFQRLDHAAIFLLIAGGYTPVHAWLFRGPWRWGVLTLVWGLAIAGLILKSIFFTALPEAVGIAAYLALGWLGLGTGYALWHHHGLRMIALPLIAGAAFSIGGLVGFAGRPNPLPGVVGAHELFHVAALVGVHALWRFMVERVARLDPIGRPFTPGEEPLATGDRAAQRTPGSARAGRAGRLASSSPRPGSTR